MSQNKLVKLATPRQVLSSSYYSDQNPQDWIKNHLDPGPGSDLVFWKSNIMKRSNSEPVSISKCKSSIRTQIQQKCKFESGSSKNDTLHFCPHHSCGSLHYRWRHYCRWVTQDRALCSTLQFVHGPKFWTQYRDSSSPGALVESKRAARYSVDLHQVRAVQGLQNSPVTGQQDIPLTSIRAGGFVLSPSKQGPPQKY